MPVKKMEENWIRILPEPPGAPAHRKKVLLNGTHEGHAFLLRSVGSGVGGRNTLVITSARHLAGLPPKVRAQYDEFVRELKRMADTWGMKAVPTLKRLARLTREGDSSVSRFTIRAVAYRHGAVVALKVGAVDGYDVAILPEELTHGKAGEKYNDEEMLEILKAHDAALPDLFVAYYEPIGFYFDAAFFGTPEPLAVEYFRRIREIIMTSIRGKLEAIENCRKGLPKSWRFAREMRRRHAKELRLAHAVDSLAHLMTNHALGMFCAPSWTGKYEQRLDALIGSHDMGESDPILFIKKCAHALREPSESFAKEVEGKKGSRPEWLTSLGRAAAFIGEINSAAGGRFDIPGIFISRQFGVQDADDFAARLGAAIRDRKLPVRLVEGKELSNDIRWSLLARVFYADLQLLYVPANLTTKDGSEKSLRTHDNWMVDEMIFSELLEHPMRVVVGQPGGGAVVEKFRKMFANYTTTREIPQISPVGWPAFIDRAKQNIVDALFANKYLNADPADFDAFMDQFENQVVEPVSRRFVGMLADSWSASYDPRVWAPMRALFAMCTCTGSGFRDNPIDALHIRCSVKDVADRMRTMVDAGVLPAEYIEGPPFVFRTRVRDQIKKLGKFYFRLDGSPHYPLRVIEAADGKLTLSFEFGDVYRLACTRLGIAPTDQQIREIAEKMVSGQD
jgi:hypothetical protein